MFNPFLASRFLSSKRLLSQKSDCSFSQSTLRCIVFKDRFAFVLSLNAGFIITKHLPFVKPFLQISDIFFAAHHIVLNEGILPQDIVVLPVFSRRSGSIFFVKKQFF